MCYRHPQSAWLLDRPTDGKDANILTLETVRKVVVEDNNGTMTSWDDFPDSTVATNDDTLWSGVDKGSTLKLEGVEFTLGPAIYVGTKHDFQITDQHSRGSPQVSYCSYLHNRSVFFHYLGRPPF